MATARRQEITRGDRVEFIGKGRKVVGTVTRIRMKHRKGKVRALAFAVTGNEGSLDRLVAEIAPEGGTGVWTVAVDSLKLLGKGDLSAAQEHVQTVKYKNKDRQHAISSRNFDSAKQGGLLDLKVGDAIEVKFREGYWSPVTFKGFVPSSGNVRYEYFGRVRTCSAKFIRLPQVQQ